MRINNFYIQQTICIDMTKSNLKESVRYIVNKHDPIKLLDVGCLIDEYDPEVKLILTKIKLTKSLDEIHDMVYNIFVDMFDKSIAGPKTKYRRLSEELYFLKQFK